MEQIPLFYVEEPKITKITFLQWQGEVRESYMEIPATSCSISREIRDSSASV